MKAFDAKPVFNKKTGQASIPLPKSKFPIDIKKDWLNIKKFKIEVKDISK